ncbi:MAG: hypothetical protein EA338_05390 [Roseinatronobacter sp.]|nr:MAG: hypothetical protein EA338_05390 [Roseinatronobacter sp.]
MIAADRVHGSAVAFEDCGKYQALLILGKSGAGKSELALELMAIGAVLVSDDQTLLHRAGTEVLCRAPQAIRGLIEMRGLGILRADTVAEAPLVAVVDLDQMETKRLPERGVADVLGVAMPCLRNCASRAFPAGLKQYVTSRTREHWQDTPQ